MWPQSIRNDRKTAILRPSCRGEKGYSFFCSLIVVTVNMLPSSTTCLLSVCLHIWLHKINYDDHKLSHEVKVKQSESRKSNHVNTRRNTHTSPLFNVLSKQKVQSHHRSKQLQSQPPDTVSQLVCTLEMQHYHVVLILWRNGK